MTTQPRMTLATRAVLGVLLDEPIEELFVREISGKTGLPSGTLHALLNRLEAIGWLVSRREDIDPHEEGRPRRLYYRLSPQGAALARAALARAAEKEVALRAKRVI